MAFPEDPNPGDKFNNDQYIYNGTTQAWESNLDERITDNEGDIASLDLTVSTDVDMGGETPTNETLSSQLAIKTYVDNEISDHDAEHTDTFIELTNLSTETDLDDGSGASNTLVSSQLAIKTYVDNEISNHDTEHDDRFLQSSAYTASDVLSKLLTVDGTGTLLDADKLDGADLSTETDLDNGSGASNTFVPSQLAVKTYVDTAMSLRLFYKKHTSVNIVMTGNTPVQNRWGGATITTLGSSFGSWGGTNGDEEFTFSEDGVYEIDANTATKTDATDNIRVIFQFSLQIDTGSGFSDIIAPVYAYNRNYSGAIRSSMLYQKAIISISSGDKICGETAVYSGETTTSSCETAYNGAFIIIKKIG